MTFIQNTADMALTHLHSPPMTGKDGIQPYDEDNWEFIRIGETVFRVPRPCTRCIFTTVHPTQGTKDEGMEPLKTLRSFRSAKSKTGMATDTISRCLLIAFVIKD